MLTHTHTHTHTHTRTHTHAHDRAGAHVYTRYRGVGANVSIPAQPTMKARVGSRRQCDADGRMRMRRKSGMSKEGLKWQQAREDRVLHLTVASLVTAFAGAGLSSPSCCAPLR